MRLFLDNTFPPRLARILRELDEDVTHLTEVEGFTGATKDEEWMPYVARQGWRAVTGDGRILTRPHERELWRSLSMSLVVMHKGYTSLSLWDQVVFVLKCWPELRRRALKARGGDVLAVKANGKIEVQQRT